MKIAIVVGHNAKVPGAYAPTPIGLSEFDFNNLVADEMIRLARSSFFGVLRGGSKLDLFKVHRTFSGSYSAEIDAAYHEVSGQGADASVELHFNAAHPRASGTETLSSGSPKSLALAGHLQRAMVKVLGRPDRGLRALGPADRGGRSLHSAPPAAALVEPFFCTNSVDLIAAQRVGMRGFARMYLEGILDYVDSEQVDVLQPAGINPRNVFGTLRLETEELTREEFFSRNRSLLTMAVENINKIQEERAHGEFFVPLTLADAFCIMNAEMGLNCGYVDPGHLHSENGIGLLPLPSNLVYWNGQDAPLDPLRLSTEQNVSEFLLYLSGIKNKPVGRPFAWGEFYADLFRHHSTTEDHPAQMHLLAGVVQGWFIPQLYRTPPDFAMIAAKTAQAHGDAQPILQELEAAGYHGNIDLLRDRLSNLNRMLAVANAPSAPESLPPLPAKVVETTGPTPPMSPTMGSERPFPMGAGFAG
jgi:N-acetylmuramoyl-L-alanine amidase